MSVSSTSKATGPGYLGRLAAAKRREVVPVWLRSLAELYGRLKIVKSSALKE